MAVYFIQHGEAGEIKIGTTGGSPQGRMASLQTGAPLELRLLVSVPGGPADERALHERFAEHRLRGEWFRPAPALLHFIEGLRWAFRDQPETVAEEPTLYGLSLEQAAALAGFIRKCLLCDRADALVERVGGEDGEDGCPSAEVDPGTLLEAVDVVAKFDDILDPTVGSYATIDGARFPNTSSLRRFRSRAQSIIDRHNEAIADRCADARLVADGAENIDPSLVGDLPFDPFEDLSARPH